MPSFIESLAAGGKQWGEYATGVEEARTAPQLAQAKVAQQQASADILRQQAELGTYDVEAAKLLKAAAPSQDYEAIFSNNASLASKVDTAKQKLARAEDLRNKTMASGKFSETTRKAYEDAQQEVKDTEAAYKADQVESMRKIMEPLAMVNDQQSWSETAPHLAQAAAETAAAEARKRGENEDFINSLKQQVFDETMKQLPRNYDASAKNLIKRKTAEYSSAADAYKIDEEIRAEEKHALGLKLVQSQIEENNAQRDKARSDASKDKSKAEQEKEKHNRINNLRQVVNTQSLELNRMTDDEENVAKTRLQNAKDAVVGIWDGWNPSQEKKDEVTTAQKAYDDLQTRKSLAQKILTKSQQDLELELEMGKVQGIEPPPIEKPAPKVDLSGYTVGGAAQGMTTEEVLADIQNTFEKLGKEVSSEQVLAEALKMGYLSPKTGGKPVKEVPAETRFRDLSENEARRKAFGLIGQDISSVLSGEVREEQRRKREEQARQVRGY